MILKPFEGLRKALERPFKGLVKAFKRPFKGLLKAFKRARARDPWVSNWIAREPWPQPVAELEMNALYPSFKRALRATF